MALGHMAFELPFVFLLLKASSSIELYIKRLYRPLTTAISLFILYFSILSFEAAARGPGAGNSAIPLEPSSYATAFVIGVVLTGFNAHFLLWWVSVGFPLITGAARSPPLGALVMYASHVWMDFAWLALLAGMGDVASTFAPAYRALMALVGLMLLLFAFDLLARAWLGKRLLPL
ncbi:LysE family transporter [Aeropyrum camini]|uniref:LysE family transporter n=1 Tax=Aeropyrum camini TaxID=229980 RepID=UPI00078716BC|nr:LysE family transporter [Aeropyrum camini]